MKRKVKTLIRKNKNAIIQLIKNGFIGMLNTVIDLGVYALMDLVFKVPLIPLKKAISYTCGVTNSFIMNRVWVFKNHKQKLRPGQIVKFLITNLTSWGASTLLIYVLENVLGLNDSLGNIFAAPVTLLINFSGYKLWVFRETPQAAAKKGSASGVTVPADSDPKADTVPEQPAEG